MKNYNIFFQNARFLTSIGLRSQFKNIEPKPQILIFGRSNSGKSTLINKLACQNKLAKTSKKPGKTRLINLFDLNQKALLSDFPGYGYAIVSHKMQQDWQELISDYLVYFESQIKLSLILTDIRHPLKESDLGMLDYCINYNINPLILLTKADKISRNKQMQSKAQVQVRLIQDYNLDLKPVIVSSTTNIGMEVLAQAIKQALQPSFEEKL